MTPLRAILAIVLLVVSATPGCPLAIVRAAAHACAPAQAVDRAGAAPATLVSAGGAPCCSICCRADAGVVEVDPEMASSDGGWHVAAGSSSPPAPCDCFGCAARDSFPAMTSIATVFDLHVALPTPLATLLGVGLHDGCWMGGMRAQLACLLAATRGEVDHPALGNGRDVLRWHCALVV